MQHLYGVISRRSVNSIIWTGDLQGRVPQDRNLTKTPHPAMHSGSSKPTWVMMYAPSRMARHSDAEAGRRPQKIQFAKVA